MFALIPNIQTPTEPTVKGKITTYELAVKDHIQAITQLPQINIEKVKARKFKVVLDTINGRNHLLSFDSAIFKSRGWWSNYEGVTRNFWM